jgi:hypothetical protein
MQQNSNDLMEERIKHMRATDDLRKRNAQLEQEYVFSSSLIRSLRDEENHKFKFVKNL